MISERTKAGMAAAKRMEKHVGRPRKLTDIQAAQALPLIEAGKESRAAVAARFGVDVATLRRAVRGQAGRYTAPGLVSVDFRQTSPVRQG